MADSTTSGDNFFKGDKAILDDLAKTEEKPQRDPCGYYAALGVSLNATPQEIRRAFLALSQRYHTDKHADQSAAIQEAMNDRFQKLMDAYAVLSDEAQRAAYDAAGADGPDRLALVPKNMRNRPDIIGYVHTLERQARLIKTAKLLAATTDMSVHYSTAHFFLPQRKLQAMAPEDTVNPAPGQREDQEEPHRTDKAKAETPPSLSPSASPAATAPAEAQKAAQPVSAAMTAREVTIDGERQFVLIPSAEMQATLRQRMLQKQGVSATSSAHGSPKTRAKMSLTRALMFAVVPKKVAFRHTFQHPVSSRIGLEVRTDATSEGQVQNISTTTAIEFQQDAVRTYAATLRTSVSGLKLAILQQRVLSPIWTMRMKLTLLNGLQYLHKLEMTMIRKLSQYTELENGLAWSLFQHGFFKSSISRTKDTSVQGLSTYIGYHGMSISAFNVQPIIYGDTVDESQAMISDDPNEEDADESGLLARYSGPAKGRLEYSVNCSPFTGQTHIGFKAWYFYSPLQHVGVSFMTVIPYSVSPLAYPLFLVGSPQHAVVNEISFLYARGRHRVSIPVIVFISPNLSRAVSWIAAPILAYKVARLVYRPYAKAYTAARYLEARRAHIAEVDLARERAMLEQLALESSVMVGRAQEDRQGGLVIINARYGVLRPRFTEDVARPVMEGGKRRRMGLVEGVKAALCCLFPRLARHGNASSSQPTTPASPDETNTSLSKTPPPLAVPTAGAVDDTLGDVPLTLDVTIAVQNMVRDSALTLPEGTKSKLAGFCDPDPFTPEKKELRVMYWFRKKKHVVVVDDLSRLDLPQREHLVS